MAGSPSVLVNGRPALRIGDRGVHSQCCGPNTWIAVEGSTSVLIDGFAAHRVGDEDMHCGGPGQMIEGSPDVIVGDDAAGGTDDGAAEAPHWVGVRVLDPFGRPISGVRFNVDGPASFTGRSIEATFKRRKLPPGEFRLELPDHPPYRVLDGKKKR